MKKRVDGVLLRKKIAGWIGQIQGDRFEFVPRQDGTWRVGASLTPRGRAIAAACGREGSLSAAVRCVREQQSATLGARYVPPPAPEAPPEVRRALKGLKWRDYRRSIAGFVFTLDEPVGLAELEQRFPGQNVQVRNGFVAVSKRVAPRPAPKGVHATWKEQVTRRAKRDGIKGEVRTYRVGGRDYAVVVANGRLQAHYRARRDGRATWALGPPPPDVLS
jgi:hypothetical protein